MKLYFDLYGYIRHWFRWVGKKAMRKFCPTYLSAMVFYQDSCPTKWRIMWLSPTEALLKGQSH